MKLLVKFVPVKVTGATKELVKENILKTRFVYTVCKNGNFFINMGADNIHETSRSVVRLFCLEKRRKKVKRVIKDGKTVSSKVISKGHWVGHYCDIPYSVILSLDLKVQQGNRTFKITSNNKGSFKLHTS